MVLLEFSMSPLDKGESVGDYVSRSIDLIDQTGVTYQTNAMGTILEGEWNEVIAVMTQCFERMQKDCNRITATMKIDYRKGTSGRIKGKIQAIEQRLGRSIQRA